MSSLIDAVKARIGELKRTLTRPRASCMHGERRPVPRSWGAGWRLASSSSFILWVFFMKANHAIDEGRIFGFALPVVVDVRNCSRCRGPGAFMMRSQRRWTMPSRSCRVLSDSGPCFRNHMTVLSRGFQTEQTSRDHLHSHSRIEASRSRQYRQRHAAQAAAG